MHLQIPLWSLPKDAFSRREFFETVSDSRVRVTFISSNYNHKSNQFHGTFL